ncbi:MAG: TetR family transcriptional regulator [Xanthobacteraceae bacterium]|nr:TetR family transcriptional regulator [Xanthobacteraceae bacterium]
MRSPASQRNSEKIPRAAGAQARRAAILSAALDEFSARGFAAARLDDVAKRAGVAKGTIYLHFRDKEALFQEIVRAEIGPFIGLLERAPDAQVPVRALMERLMEAFVREVLTTRRRDILRLIITEGPRFPALAEFYYREVVSRGAAAMRGLMRRAAERGEVPSDAVARFPQLIVAPALLTVIWNSLFENLEPLDAAEMMRAHLDVVFGVKS